LVNRYPAVSHTFIRREIEGVEKSGWGVVRYSIRRVEEKDLVDDRDRAEQRLTRVILDGGLGSLLAGLARLLFRHPLRFLRAFRLAWRVGGGSRNGRLIHFAYLAEAAVLVRSIQSVGAVHLHAHFGTNPAMVALFTRVLGGPPFSFTVHGPEEFDRPESLALREKIRASSFVAGVSDFGRSQLMRWTEPADWEKLHVIRCGVSGPFIDSESSPVPDGRRMVCVGRLCEDKGQLLLVEAARRLSREFPDLEIILVGDGALRGRIECRIRELGMERHVLLRGTMDGEGVRKELLQSRGLVLPSCAEGLPVVIMEALGLGRPVISTYVAGIPELVKPGVNGWLVPAGSMEALVEALREALLSPSARLTEMGRAGQAAVREKHNAQSEARRLVELFRGSLTSSVPR
jgi:glycosyltransferase involved in cell wall biosynthesis